MKEKTAKIIRIITIPPIEALVMLLILYRLKQEEFGNLGNLLMAVLFLTVIPICSYPIASRKRGKQDMRNNQRNMAFIFNSLSYLAAMLIGYCVGVYQNAAMDSKYSSLAIAPDFSSSFLSVHSFRKSLRTP